MTEMQKIEFDVAVELMSDAMNELEADGFAVRPLGPGLQVVKRSTNERFFAIFPKPGTFEFIAANVDFSSVPSSVEVSAYALAEAFEVANRLAA